MFQIENSKQGEFLGDIRDLGMGIVFGKTTGEDIERTFVPYAEYIEDEKLVLKYFEAIYRLAHSTPTPDDLLLGLGRFTLDIVYEEEEEENCGCNCLFF